MEGVMVEVTSDDIANGRPQSPCGCPLAIAAGRALGIDTQWGGFDIDIDGLYLDDDQGLRRASARLPKAAREFIAKFDAGQPVSPFAFHLNMLEWWRRRSGW